MRGHDLTSSHLAEPPLPPIDASDVTPYRLAALGRSVVDRTWAHGLPTWSWGEAVALVGMVRFSDALGDDVPAGVSRWLDDRFAEGVHIEHVNDVAPGIAAVLMGGGDDDSTLSRVQPLVSWVESSPPATRSANGAIEHWPGGVWADTAFMAGVFLGHVGAAGGDGRLLDECGHQLVAHAEILQAPSGLFAHGSHRGETIPCFWGRANAWCALAAVEYLELAKSTGTADLSLIERVSGVLLRQLVALADSQPDHGVWSVLVDEQPECAGIVEASAAAGIAAAMVRAAGVVPELPTAVVDAGWLAIRGALAYVDGDGTLTRTSAGTVLQLIPFGYSVIRSDRLQLWGQGLALHAIAAAIEALS
ncbi:rhamnogalacturonyl hydrolase YesR [soil metagenome]